MHAGAEGTRIKVDGAAWDELLALLDRPVIRKPRLEKLLAEPPIFGGDA